MNADNPEIITGAEHTDSRGTISFINNFDMSQIKRVYTITHPDLEVVRAWQGHQIEQKWFHVIRGGFNIFLVQPDNWDKPSHKLAVQSFELFCSNYQVLHVPGGYATGFCALERDSKIMIYSNLSLEESINDDYRFTKNLWCNWDTIIVNEA